MQAKLLLAIVTSVALCFALTPVRAQEPSTLHADIAGITSAGYPAARAVVNLDDATGEAVKSLTAASFTVTVGGQPAPVLSADIASSQTAPLDVLLLMDVSGSMAGDPMAQAKAAAKGLVLGLGAGDRVAVISFADQVTLVQDYTPDRAATDAVIDGLVARGNTALYDATAAAALKAGTSPSSRRAVILVSDGAQDGVTLQTTRDAALAAAAGVGVPYFAIGEGSNIDRDYLNQLAAASHGRYLEAPQASDLSDLFASIGQLLTGQFIIAFDARSAAGVAEAPVTITVQAGAASATALGVFKPGPGFVPSAIEVALSGVKAGEEITEPRQITAVPASTVGVTRVAFYVDDVNVYETATSPYVFNYNPSAYKAATHTLKAAAIAGGSSFESPPVFFSSHGAPAAAGGGGPSILMVGAVIAILVVLAAGGGVGTVVARRLRSGPGVTVVSADQRITPWVSRHRAVSEPKPDAPPQAEAEAVEEIGEPLGVLIARAGPLTGTECIVGGKPVSIGAGARCAVRIDDPSLSAEEARIWVRDGHLMLHKIARITSVSADSVAPTGWTILEPGDHLDIGWHRFEFQLWAPKEPEPEREPEDIPNVLRDDSAARPSGRGPSASPATASGLGAIWPMDPRPAAPASAPDDDIDAQAS